MTEIPKKITSDQYDILMRELWEMKQKMVVLERATLQAVSLDMVFDQNAEIKKELRLIRKMNTKIGVALYKKALK